MVKSALLVVPVLEPGDESPPDDVTPGSGSPVVDAATAGAVVVGGAASSPTWVTCAQEYEYLLADIARDGFCALLYILDNMAKTEKIPT